MTGRGYWLAGLFVLAWLALMSPDPLLLLPLVAGVALAAPEIPDRPKRRDP